MRSGAAGASGAGDGCECLVQPLSHNPEGAPNPGRWVISLLPILNRIQAAGGKRWQQGSGTLTGLLSPQYEKVQKLTADARFGEYPTESTGFGQLWLLGLAPGAETLFPAAHSDPAALAEEPEEKTWAVYPSVLCRQQ